MGIKDNTCDICGKHLVFKVDKPRTIDNKYMCKPCFDRMMAVERGEMQQEEFDKIVEASRKENELTSTLQAKYGGIMMSTTSSIDGYRIIENKGLVFGETVFKHGFLSSLGAGLSDALDLLTFSSTEMSGSVQLIERAREYAYSKMVKQAESLGANAIVGIDSDNTVGGEIMYISLYGTAVLVEKIETEEPTDK